MPDIEDKFYSILHPIRERLEKETIAKVFQSLDDEWGYFSQAEIERLNPFAWEIPKKNLVYSGKHKN